MGWLVRILLKIFGLCVVAMILVFVGLKLWRDLNADSYAREKWQKASTLQQSPDSIQIFPVQYQFQQRRWLTARSRLAEGANGLILTQDGKTCSVITGAYFVSEWDSFKEHVTTTFGTLLDGCDITPGSYQGIFIRGWNASGPREALDLKSEQIPMSPELEAKAQSAVAALKEKPGFRQFEWAPSVDRVALPNGGSVWVLHGDRNQMNEPCDGPVIIEDQAVGACVSAMGLYRLGGRLLLAIEQHAWVPGPSNDWIEFHYFEVLPNGKLVRVSDTTHP